MHRSISFTAVRHGRSLEIAGGHHAILSTSAASAVLPDGCCAVGHLEREPAGHYRLGEDGAPADAACQHRRIILGERLCNLMGIEVVRVRRLRTIRVRSRGRNVFASLTNLSVSAKAARTNDGSRTGTSTKSTVSRAARERGDMAQSIHDHAIDVTSDVLRVAVKRVPRETDDSEAARQPFLRPHLGPLKRAALRVRIDYGDVLSPVRPEAGGVQRQRHLGDPVRLGEERDDHGSPPDDARYRIDGFRRATVGTSSGSRTPW
jgi:hypothetical protein